MDRPFDKATSAICGAHPPGALRVLAAPAHYQLDGSLGSESEWAANIVQRLASAGHRVVAIAGHSTLPDTSNLTVVPLWERPSPTRLRDRADFVFRYARTGADWLRRSEFDVLHHILPFALGWTFNPLALRSSLGLPFVLGPVQTLHGGDLSDEGPESRIFEGARTRRHLPDPTRALRVLVGPLSRRTLSCADVVIAVSEAARASCLEVQPRANVRVVSPGVDSEHFAPGPAPGRDDEVLMVGHLVRRKQVDLVIRAIAMLRTQGVSATLRIVGDGPERAHLERMASHLGVGNNVAFEGRVDRAQLPLYYRNAAIACLVSRAESVGMAALEAMACGLPVVSTRTALMGPFLRDHRAGIAVDGDPSAIAVALETLLGNPGMRLDMGRTGRAAILRCHDWATIADAYVEAYQDAIRIRSQRQ